MTGKAAHAKVVNGGSVDTGRGLSGPEQGKRYASERCYKYQRDIISSFYTSSDPGVKS